MNSFEKKIKLSNTSENMQRLNQEMNCLKAKDSISNEEVFRSSLSGHFKRENTIIIFSFIKINNYERQINELKYNLEELQRDKIMLMDQVSDQLFKDFKKTKQQVNNIFIQ